MHSCRIVPRFFFTLVNNTARDTDTHSCIVFSGVPVTTACLNKTLRDIVWIVDGNNGTSPISVSVVY